MHYLKEDDLLMVVIALQQAIIDYQAGDWDLGSFDVEKANELVSKLLSLNPTPVPQVYSINCLRH